MGNHKLYEIAFSPFGSPCVESVSISYGSDAVPESGRIQTHYTHMNAAWGRKEFIGKRSDIITEWLKDCVRFFEQSYEHGYRSMHINPAIFKCELNDDQCIQSHLDLH